METLTFAGMVGRITDISPNGNYVTLRLSDRVTIIGTFSNEYSWDEIGDSSSGFIAFITYIGTDGLIQDTNFIYDFVAKHGGYFRHREEHPRLSKRTEFPKEIKVRGLHPESVIDLISHFDNHQWQAA